MSNQEWGNLPWYETQALLEGLNTEFADDGKSQSYRAPESAGSKPGPVTDLTRLDADLSGFGV